jgi:2',3'-cyclic-nucleotide 2'-phosphodiesterase / 3'-nucleotidase / 5'-nucleotidase
MIRRLLSPFAVLGVLVALFALLALPTMPSVTAAPESTVPQGSNAISIQPIGTFTTGAFDEGAAEIVSYDAASERLFIVNALSATVDIVDISDPTTPTLVDTIDATSFGASVNSVDVHNGLVALVVESDPTTNPGVAVFTNISGTVLFSATVGALPDMITFTPDGNFVLVANEGEPGDVDPEGSITIIDAPAGANEPFNGGVVTAGFTQYNGQEDALRAQGVRIFPGVSAANDFEPEYIAVSPDSTTAYVTLQEANTVAVVDIAGGTVTDLVPLGRKDWRTVGARLDASDDDGTINFQNWPVYGLYMPDTIEAASIGGNTYLFTANEGDVRNEDARVGSLTLDSTAFPTATILQEDANLGRLYVSEIDGDTDDDGAYEELYAYGARSFSIWSSAGALVWDSGDQLEQITAAIYPETFNASNTNNTFDNRSDDKGPEPEAITTGTIGGRTYAFVGLERVSGIVVYDVTTPTAPVFVHYLNNRDFNVDPEDGTADGTVGDIAPEGMKFIPANESPNEEDLLVVANEVSGSTTIYRVASPDGAGALTLLHNNDGESTILPINYTVEVSTGTVQLPTAGVAAYATVVDQNIADARSSGNSVLNVYAGDAFLASATLACSLPPAPANTPIYDAVAQAAIPYDAHIFGNHEFDYSPDFLERFVRAFETNGVLQQPFLSANLDFSAEAGWADLLDADGVYVASSTDGRVVAQSMIVYDKRTGQRFGVVGATTWLLPTISSPRDVTVTEDITSTATVAQTEIDRLYDEYGIRKIIFVSHLQDVDNDKDLVSLLSRVDIAVAGGGDELLTNPNIPDTIELLPGEQAPSAGTYPFEQEDADGRTVYIVTTAGNYKYMGRLDVLFDVNGEITSIDLDTSYPRRVIPTGDVATQLGLTDAVTPDAEIVANVVDPVEACLDTFAQTTVITTEIPLDVSRNTVRGAESNGGNLITDGYIYTYDQVAAENGLPPRIVTGTLSVGDDPVYVIALTNGGGIRQNAGDTLEVGPISRLDTLNVLPFDNYLTVVTEVTPTELQGILERSASGLPGAAGQFLQQSGIDVVYTVNRPVDSRVKRATLADGTTIIQNYNVVEGAPNVYIVTNSFTANGGDNYVTFANIPAERKVRLLDDGATISYERGLMLYLASNEFPTNTILADDPRYQPGGEGRMTFNRERYMPLIFVLSGAETEE